MAQFPFRSLLRGEIAAHRRNAHGLTGSGMVDAKPVHEKGHRNPGLEMAKSKLAPPTTHSHHGRPALLAGAGAILGNQKIQYMQTSKLFDRCQTDELQTGGIEIVWYAIEARNADKIRGSFDQRYEALLRRFRVPSLQRDGRAVRSDIQQQPLHIRREIRLPGSGNDHCIPAKAEWGRSDADYAFVKRVGDNPRLFASSEPHSRKIARIRFSRIGTGRGLDVDGLNGRLAFVARQRDIDEIRSEHGE